MDTKKRFVVNPLIVLREEFDDWAVLFDPDTGEAYGVDPTGVAIWNLLDGKNSISEIIGKIAELFDDVPENADEEIIDFLKTLNQKGYITNV